MIPLHRCVHDSTGQFEMGSVVQLEGAGRPIQPYHVLQAAHPQAALLIGQPFMPGVLWYAGLVVEHVDSSTHHATEVMAATEPQRAVWIDKSAGLLCELRQRPQLLGLEVRATVPFGATGLHPQLQQPTFVEHPQPVLSGREQPSTVIETELLPIRPHGAKPLPVAQIEIVRLADPQSPGTVLQDAKYVRVFEPFGITEALEVVTVVTEQPVLGADPYEAVAILQ